MPVKKTFELNPNDEVASELTSLTSNIKSGTFFPSIFRQILQLLHQIVIVFYNSGRF